MALVMLPVPSRRATAVVAIELKERGFLVGRTLRVRLDD